METKFLSSAQTFIMKFVFPAIWISMFGAATLALWSGSMQARNGQNLPMEMKWVFLFGWIAGSAMILWFCAPLKRVRMDGAILHVSNYLREIAVPLTSIDRVAENRWINIHPVTIHFRRTTEFGDAIRFMPTARMFGFFSAHPVVAELEQAVFAQRVQSRSN
ncbi:MAG: hypothetical protein ABIS07_01510 [Dokdonella sp.]